jgi:hypothetical protein
VTAQAVLYLCPQEAMGYLIQEVAVEQVAEHTLFLAPQATAAPASSSSATELHSSLALVVSPFNKYSRSIKKQYKIGKNPIIGSIGNKTPINYLKFAVPPVKK